MPYMHADLRQGQAETLKTHCSPGDGVPGQETACSVPNTPEYTIIVNDPGIRLDRSPSGAFVFLIRSLK